MNGSLKYQNMNRLKTTLTFLIIIMTLGISNAQFGVRAGVNLASLKIKADFFGASFVINTDTKIGGHIGAFYREEVNEKFSIRPNLIFTTGGGKVEDASTGESNSINISYLGLPIDFMYTLPAGENSFSLMGGPFFGYLLSTSTNEGSVEEGEGFTSLDYGINIGVQFQIKSFGIGLTYGLGLANIAPEEEINSQFFEANTSASTKVTSIFFTYDL